MIFTDIPVQVDRADVMTSLNCFPDSAIYDEVAQEYETIKDRVLPLLQPRAAAVMEAEEAYVLITLGEAVTGLIQSLFDEGEYMGGMLADTIADQCLFSADTYVAEQLKIVCADRKAGVKARLEAPEAMPMERQAEILEKTEGTKQLGVTITSGLMYAPVKSMGYILELTADPEVFRAEHDCSRCKAKNCRSRKRAEKRMESKE